MKKIITIITGYWLFCFLCSVLPVAAKYSLEDVSNLLFLNSKTFTGYGLTEPSFSYIIVFCLFFFLLFYLLYNSVNEYVSFAQMKMYRTDKKQTFRKCLIRDLKSCLIIFALTWGIVVFFTVLVLRIEVTAIMVLTLGLYLVKFFSFFFIVTLLYDIGSFVGLHTQASFFGIFLTMAALVSDIASEIHLITYSGSFQFELLASVIMVLLNIGVSYLCWNIFRKRGDIL